MQKNMIQKFKKDLDNIKSHTSNLIPVTHSSHHVDNINKVSMVSELQTTNHAEANALKNNHVSDLPSEYHEILFSFECVPTYLNEILSQAIADIILEHGDGVEFLPKDMIQIQE
ncbi:hypothetical protein CQA53_02915 [Helicobacter didelphidarum]|uniref:Uncharacterized protein n=1 Tax=Helicobacter didelphidarum TaxID=2040648 RepID=A0A3D8IN85_9HELI|nr:hypothetical protein [Helicobacter didelphidarum]RDU66737.1 hypothetical protein CQA53_02915 [Helicobacter didelphidarum]